LVGRQSGPTVFLPIDYYVFQYTERKLMKSMLSQYPTFIKKISSNFNQFCFCTCIYSFQSFVLALCSIHDIDLRERQAEELL
jgi:hypothetical protein